MTFQSGEVHQPSGQAAPGWYLIDASRQQYWDGAQWVGDPQPGQPQASGQWPQQPLVNGTTNDDRTMALLTHLSIFIAAGIAPLVIYLVKKDTSPFVRHHSAEALNLIITVFMTTLGMFALGGVFFVASSISEIFTVIGAALFFAGYLAVFCFMILGAVLSVIAAIKANKGESYRMPFVLHLVK